MAVKKIGVITAGGDCPGLNAVIRSVVKRGIVDYNIEAIGFLDGYRGLVENKSIDLTYDRVSGILNAGGTILGSSNRDNPFNFYYDNKQEEPIDVSNLVVENYEKNKLDALVCIGGDGTLTMAHMFAKKGLNVIGVPKTIDNDVQGTDQTFGFDTAVYTATSAIDQIRTTAASHHRVLVVELMGRTAGWLALFSGIASGSDVILIPEIPFNIDSICNFVTDRSTRGKRYSIIACAEGAKPAGGDSIVIENKDKRTGMVRLGGVGNYVAQEIEDKTEISSRTTVLGHLQRGGSPTPSDRILASRYGSKAMELVMDGVFDVTVCLKGNKIENFPLDKVANNPRLVSRDSEFLQIARSVNVSLGE